MEKLEVVNEAWDLKKILALVAILGVLAFGVKTLVLDKSVSVPQNTTAQVEGAKTSNSSVNISPSKELQQNVQTGLDNLRKEVNNINVVDVATSTPAVQKVINDLKNLQNLPQNQAKQACIKICDGL